MIKISKTRKPIQILEGDTVNSGVLYPPKRPLFLIKKQGRGTGPVSSQKTESFIVQQDLKENTVKSLLKGSQRKEQLLISK